MIICSAVESSLAKLKAPIEEVPVEEPVAAEAEPPLPEASVVESTIPEQKGQEEILIQERSESTTISTVTGTETHLSAGLLVAVLCRVDEEASTDDWMLATVQHFHPDSRLWEVEDCEEASTGEDDVTLVIVPGGGSGKRRHVELARVIRMPQSDDEALSHEELKPKTAVLGLYPGTTCLYPAVVVTPPSRRKKTRDYLLRFNDDEVPSRPCPARYVIAIPNLGQGVAP